MAGEHDIRQRAERAGVWFGFVHVEGRSRDPSLAERIEERILVDEATSCGIDDDTVRAESVKDRRSTV